MNWSALPGIVALLASGVSAWLALSLRAERAERRLEMEKMSAGIRSDINGSYLRSNVVLQLFETIRAEIRGDHESVHTELRAIGARITLMEQK